MALALYNAALVVAETCRGDDWALYRVDTCDVPNLYPLYASVCAQVALSPRWFAQRTSLGEESTPHGRGTTLSRRLSPCLKVRQRVR